MHVYPVYVYTHAYTERITCQQSVLKIFLYERPRSACIILRNNRIGVPAR
jgi:hypothetical protein